MKKRFWGLKDLNFAGKTVLVRADFNVPLNEQGKILDDSKICAALPTIKYLLQRKAKIVLMSHLGRPKGFEQKLMMNNVAKRLQELLKCSVTKLDDCVGEEVDLVVKGMRNAEIVLLENLRFHPEEEANSRVFAKALASTSDIYVDEAFGCMHRSHASIDAITEFLPSCAGFLVEKELSMLKNLLERQRRPFVAMMGGAKVSDKIKMITNLLKKVDFLLVGGAMMFTFLKCNGKNIGRSLAENNLCNLARELLRSKKIILPVDVVGDVRADGKAKPKIASVDCIPNNFIGLDIGPETIDLFCNIIKPAKTIFWNGPLGMCELKNFCHGTERIAKCVAGKRAIKIVGGGDTIRIVEKLGLAKKFSHVSTGGGATLEFLEFGTLPGIVALEQSFQRFFKYKRRGAV